MIKVFNLLLVIISLSLVSCHNQNIQQENVKPFSQIKEQFEKQIEYIDKNYKKIPKKIKSLQKTLKNKVTQSYSNFLLPYPNTKYSYDMHNTLFSKNPSYLLSIYDNNITKTASYTITKIQQQYENISKIAVNKDASIKLSIDNSTIELKIISLL